MKKNLLLFFAFAALSTNILNSQSTTPKFLSVLSSNYNLSNDFVVPIGNAQALSVGNTRYSGVYGNDGIGTTTITRLDSAARPLWSKFYDFRDTGTSHFNSVFADIKQAVDGHFGLVGNTGVYLPNFSSYPASGSGFIVKINSNGAVLWTSKFANQATSYYVPLSLTACSDSGFAVCGKVLPVPGSILGCMFIARINKTGSLLWMKKDTSTIVSSASSIVNVGDTSFYLLGARKYAGKEVSTLWRFGANGTLQWMKHYDLNTANNTGFSLVSTGDGLVCIGGNYEVYLYKVNYNGALVFAKKYDASHYYTSYENCRPKIKLLKNQGLLISNPGGSPAAIITNSLGNVQWNVSIRGFNSPSDATQLNNKDFLFTENTNYTYVTIDKDTLVWGQEGFIVTDSLGSGNGRCYVKSNITSSTTVLSATTISTLFQNTGTLSPFQTTVTAINTSQFVGCLGYPTGIAESSLTQLKLFPNPASHSINFVSDNMNLEGSSFALFNLDGKEMLHSELHTLGEVTSVTIDGLPSGVYFYRLQCPQNETIVGKLIIAQGD